MEEPATSLAPAKDTGRSPLARGMALSVASAFFFGTLAIFAKFAYEARADVLPLLSLRFVVASLLLALFLKARGTPLGLDRRNLLKLLALGAGAYGVESMLFFLALERAPAAVVGLVFYSNPIWTTVGAVAFGLDRFRWKLVVALTVATTGIVLIFSLPATGLAGPLFALAAAVAVAAYFLLTQTMLRNVQPSVAAMWTSIGAAGFSLAGTALTGSSLPVAAIGPGVGLGFVTAIAFLLMYSAIEQIGSSRFAIAATFEPVTTLVLAAVFLGEDITMRILLGGALVVSALPILARSEPRRPVPAPDTL